MSQQPLSHVVGRGNMVVIQEDPLADLILEDFGADAIDAGSLIATKWKKLRIAASLQLRVPIVPPRSCSA